MYRRGAAVAILVAGVCCGAENARCADPPRRPDVAELLEDDGEALLKQLTNPTGDPGEGHVEKAVVFSGKSSVRIVPMQRFQPSIPGWKYRIAEKPKPGEYRYLRFAWKADGCLGIMLQLHDEKDWVIRYTAGQDVYNWGTKFVADKPPPEWAVVTVDLFKDFGERTIQGIALTAHGGRAGYFDHIYFGRTVEDLDRIDATGLRAGKPHELAPADLDRLWGDLTASDAAKAYLAFWSLTASPKQAVPFLRRKLAGEPAGEGGKRLAQWVRELDDDDFEVRERATAELGKHLEAAAAILERALAAPPSAETKVRLERILAGRGSPEAMVEKAVRMLEYMGSPEARACLSELAKGEDARLKAFAQAALKRLEALAAK
jgi:hypothetical protein